MDVRLTGSARSIQGGSLAERKEEREKGGREGGREGGGVPVCVVHDLHAGRHHLGHQGLLVFA